MENQRYNTIICFKYDFHNIFQLNPVCIFSPQLETLSLEKSDEVVENPAQKSVSKLFATVQINKRSCAPDRVRPLDLHGHEEPALGDLVEVAPYVRPERPEPSGKFSDS